MNLSFVCQFTHVRVSMCTCVSINLFTSCVFFWRCVCTCVVFSGVVCAHVVFFLTLCVRMCFFLVLCVRMCCFFWRCVCICVVFVAVRLTGYCILVTVNYIIFLQLICFCFCYFSMCVYKVGLFYGGLFLPYQIGAQARLTLILVFCM